MHPHAHIREHEQRRAEERLRHAGYAHGGKVRESDEAQDKRMVAKAIAEHERHDHKGEPLTQLHLRGGGKVSGERPKHRPDKMARGGKVKGPARVNIIISNGGGEGERQMAFRQGAQTGAMMGAAQAARPPVAPSRPPMMPPGAAPGGAPPVPPGAAMTGAMPGTMPPRPPMKRGGVVEIGGAGGAEGRLEKAGMESTVKVRGYERRKAGGRV